MGVLTAVDDADPSVHRYAARNNDRTVAIDVLGTRSDTEAEATALDALNWVGTHNLELKARCADDLLDDYNDEWAQADEGRADIDEPLPAAAFRARLALQGVVVLDDGSLRVLYDDDGMFSNHDIVVITSRERELIRAVLEG